MNIIARGQITVALSEKGEKGDTGDTGTKGDKGDKDNTGNTGATGPKGDAGAVGPAGLGYFENSEPQGYYTSVLNYEYYYAWEEFLYSGLPEEEYELWSEFHSWDEFRNSGYLFESFSYEYSDRIDYDSSGYHEIYILDYIRKPYYTYQWNTITWSLNRGIMVDVKNAWQNVALDVLNGYAFFRRGAVVQWTDKYIGTAYTDILEQYIGQTNIFIFTYISSSTLTVRMPTATHINRFSAGASSSVTFEFTVVIATSSNKVRLTSQTGGQIRNNNNGNVSYIDMGAGDVATFIYRGGYYYEKVLRQ